MKRGKNFTLLLTGLILVFTLCACSDSSSLSPDAERPPVASPFSSEDSGQISADALEENASEMTAISLTVGGETFTALLEDNETARVFYERLPLTLDMSELNGNEKYYYMDASLPTNAENPGQIKAGDLMLYGDTCLVLFFDAFSTSYSYTRLGSVADAARLVDTLQSGTVTVTFAPME